MKPHLTAAGVVAAVLLAGACSNDNNNPVTPTTTAQVRVVNASSSQTTPVDLVNGSTTLASSVSFQGSSAQCVSIPAGSQQSLVFRAGTDTLASLPVTLTANTRYTIALFGTGTTHTAKVFTDTFTTPTTGNNAVRVINATASPGDVFISAPGAALTTPSFSDIAVDDQSPTFATFPTTATQVSLFDVGTTTGTPRAAFTLPADLGGNRVATVFLTGTTTTGGATAFVVTPCP